MYYLPQLLDGLDLAPCQATSNQLPVTKSVVGGSQSQCSPRALDKYL